MSIHTPVLSVFSPINFKLKLPHKHPSYEHTKINTQPQILKALKVRAK